MKESKMFNPVIYHMIHFVIVIITLLVILLVPSSINETIFEIEFLFWVSFLIYWFPMVLNICIELNDFQLESTYTNDKNIEQTISYTNKELLGASRFIPYLLFGYTTNSLFSFITNKTPCYTSICMIANDSNYHTRKLEELEIKRLQ